ncbi:ArsR/SmtB family transcription factor [Bacillus cereus]
MPKKFYMDVNDYERSAEILTALAHPMRLCIMKNLVTKGPLSVSELWKTLELPQSTVSQYLIKLKFHKVVSYERRGVEIYYKVDDPTIIEVIKTLKL